MNIEIDRKNVSKRISWQSERIRIQRTRYGESKKAKEQKKKRRALNKLAENV